MCILINTQVSARENALEMHTEIFFILLTLMKAELIQVW